MDMYFLNNWTEIEGPQQYIFVTFDLKDTVVFKYKAWNLLISRFMEDVNTRQRFSFLFLWT